MTMRKLSLFYISHYVFATIRIKHRFQCRLYNLHTIFECYQHLYKMRLFSILRSRASRLYFSLNFTLKRTCFPDFRSIICPNLGVGVSLSDFFILILFVEGVLAERFFQENVRQIHHNQQKNVYNLYTFKCTYTYKCIQFVRYI